MPNPISPNAGRDTKNKPDKEWEGLTADSFDGSGFEALDIKAKTARHWGEKRNKFITGASRFISYEIKFDRKKAALERPSLNKKKSINELAKLTKNQRSSLTDAIQTQIKDASTFLWKEVLPLTLSWSTALQDTEERLLQVVGTEKLPIGYIINRVTEAAHLKINRYIAGQFELTSEEAKILQLAITARYRMEDG
jgi:hypothetical protein